MNLLRNILSKLSAIFLGRIHQPSASTDKIKGLLDHQSEALKRALTGIGRRKDDITIRSLCRTTNQRKRRNLMRWARANGSA